jgi:hypothetical protein
MFEPRFLVDADVVVIASTAIVLLMDATELSRMAYSARCYSTYTRLVCGVTMQSTLANPGGPTMPSMSPYLPVTHPTALVCASGRHAYEL